MQQRRIFAAAAFAALLCPAALSATDNSEKTVRRMPTSGSLMRQNAVARAEGYSFLRTPADVWAKVAGGRLVRIEGNGNFELAAVSFPVARPEVRLFLEQLGAEHRAACGEPLVVTSLTRPITRQPANAAHNSVHPAGMAVDLRIPSNAVCRRWLEQRLLEMQAADLLDVIREQRPPHYHVGLFPSAYRQYVQRGVAAESARLAQRDARELRRQVERLVDRIQPDDASGDGAPRSRLRWAALLFAVPLSVLVWVPSVVRRVTNSGEVGYWLRVGRAVLR